VATTTSVPTVPTSHHNLTHVSTQITSSKAVRLCKVAHMANRGVATATGILCSTRVKVLFDVIYRPTVAIVRAPAAKLNTCSQPRDSGSSGQSVSCTAAFCRLAHWTRASRLLPYTSGLGLAQPQNTPWHPPSPPTHRARRGKLKHALTLHADLPGHATESKESSQSSLSA
jgi:hypothetical protein